MRYAALLKGVNVGGNRKLPMADLRALVAGAGFGEVETLLASGNVVFSADEGDTAKLEKALEAVLAQAGLTTDVLVRTLADLATVIDANPFTDAARERPSHLLVHFHRGRVPDGLIEQLPEVYAGPEQLQAVGRELFVDYPDDIGHSKLPQAMAKLKFPKLATARNWNTVVKLVGLLG